MLPRSRSVRFAGLTLALTAPLVAAHAAPGFAAGSTAVVNAVVSDGNVQVSSTKGLSRVTVVLCDGDTVVTDDWEADQKSGDVPVEGVVQAVFVHSGSNTTPEAQALLALLAGADALKGNSTGAIAFHDADACDEPDVNDEGDGGDDGTEGGDDDGQRDDDGGDGGGNTGDDDGDDGGDSGGDTGTPATGSDPVPTIVLPATAEKPEVTTVVLGETLEQAGGELPRTGAGHVQALAALGLALVAAGTGLRTAVSRRVRSAFSPG